MAGATWYVESLETTLHQDLNGDTHDRPHHRDDRSIGATTLTKVADSYFFNYASGGPQLKLNGAYVAAGQLGDVDADRRGATWAEPAIGSPGRTARLISTPSGRPTAPATTVSNMIGANVSGTTSALQQFEPFFQQDLNGDGVIPIEAVGATKLVKSGNNYVLDPMASLGGPLLKYSGANVTVGQFGALDADRRRTDGERL